MGVAEEIMTAYETGKEHERERILKALTLFWNKYDKGEIGDVDEFAIKLKNEIVSANVKDTSEVKDED